MTKKSIALSQIDFEHYSNASHDLVEEQQQIDEKTRGTCNNFNTKSKYHVYEKAINELEEYSYPTTIPCRTEEKDVIMKFIRDGVETKGCGSTLFISGFPGVGKTICVKDTIETFKRRYQRTSSFADIHINAMNLIKPNYIYGAILKQLTNLEISGCKVLPILNEVLTKGTFPVTLYNKHLSNTQLRDIEKKISKTKILTIDEIDYLFTKDEDVLYNLFEWTQSANSKIVLITISNTFTFPEKLEQKIISRIGSQRLIFKTYTSSQIELILNERMKQLEIFEKEGIRLISKKLSTTSDIRKCLFILRESVTKFLEMKKLGETEETLISMDIVLNKIKQLYDNPLVNSLKDLPKIQKTVLLRVIEVIKESGIQCWISELYIQIRLKKDKLPLTKSTVVQEALARLKELNIIKMSIQSRSKEQRLTSSKMVPLHVSEFRIELNIDLVSLLKGIDAL